MSCHLTPSLWRLCNGDITVSFMLDFFIGMYIKFSDYLKHINNMTMRLIEYVICFYEIL